MHATRVSVNQATLELTYDYMLPSSQAGTTCLCRTKKCRGTFCIPENCVVNTWDTLRDQWMGGGTYFDPSKPSITICELPKPTEVQKGMMLAVWALQRDILRENAEKKKGLKKKGLAGSKS